MPYQSINQLPDTVKEELPDREDQREYMMIYNAVLAETGDEERAHQQAMLAVNADKDEDGGPEQDPKGLKDADLTMLTERLRSEIAELRQTLLDYLDQQQHQQQQQQQQQQNPGPSPEDADAVLEIEVPQPQEERRPRSVLRKKRRK